MTAMDICWLVAMTVVVLLGFAADIERWRIARETKKIAEGTDEAVREIARLAAERWALAERRIELADQRNARVNDVCDRLSAIILRDAEGHHES